MTRLENRNICFDLKDKVALITGAGQGIGENIAMRLAEEKAIVVLNEIGLSLFRQAENPVL